MAKAHAGNLFVYGSLMSAARHPMGARLRREARLRGAAAIPGRLYAVSWYPGLVDAAPDDDVLVHGELYALNNAAATFRWLDLYEGIAPGGDGGGEFKRVLRDVILSGAADTPSTLEASVYLYTEPSRGLRLIPDGRWTTPL